MRTLPLKATRVWMFCLAVFCLAAQASQYQTLTHRFYSIAAEDGFDLEASTNNLLSFQFRR